jgi:hypothetical protein
MRFVTIVKKMGVPFLGIILFVSCGSDDSGTVKKKCKSGREKLYEGINSKEVSRIRIRPGQCIVYR